MTGYTGARREGGGGVTNKHLSHSFSCDNTVP